MKLKKKRLCLAVFVYLIPFLLNAQNIKVLTNHVGYESGKAKQAVLKIQQVAFWSWAMCQNYAPIFGFLLELAQAQSGIVFFRFGSMVDFYLVTYSEYIREILVKQG